MNLKKKILLSLLLSLGVIFMQYESSNQKNFTLPQKTLLSIDEKVFLNFSKNYDVNRELNRYWGFQKEKSEQKELVELNATKTTQVEKTKGQNQLCIENSCYRLLDIHYRGSKAMITLYNANATQKIKEYSLHEELEANVSIQNITSSSVLFQEAATPKTWKFTIFDVNETKYKPKETENE